MKRIFAVLTALMVLGTLTACGETENQSAPDSSQPAQEEITSEGGTSSVPDELSLIHISVAGSSS